MKVLILLAALCATALAVPNGKRLRPEEHWRTSAPRDLSKYKPRQATVAPNQASWEQDMVSINKEAQKLRAQIAHHQPSKYDLMAECGVEGPPAADKIVGGEEATPNQFPWIVALFVDNAWFCGGALISENWVLTAAHCVDGASYFDIIAGAHNVDDASEPHRMEITSYNGFTHPEWDSSVLANDVALIELPSAVEFNDYVKPSCLPSAGEEVSAGDLVSIIGWGKPSDAAGGKSPVLRMFHDLPVISNEQCNALYGIIGDGIVCVDSTGGHGTCNGDSGGPLIQKSMKKDAGDKWTQVGVVSFVSSNGCESGDPDGFARTEYYLDWIMQNTGIKY